MRSRCGVGQVKRGCGGVDAGDGSRDGELTDELAVAVERVSVVVQIETDDRVAVRGAGPLIIKIYAKGLAEGEAFRISPVELNQAGPGPVVGGQSNSVVRHARAQIPHLVVAVTDHARSRAKR